MTEALPPVSVVMPVYNAEAFVQEALDSVFAQDYDSFEVIVVDDGSQDAGGEIASAYPGVRFLRQENRGANAARNLAISHATGELVAFVDADDVVPPDKLRLQAGYLAEHPGIAAVLGRQEWMNPPPWLVRDQVWGDLDGIPVLSTVIRRSVLDDLGELDEHPNGDLDMLVRMRERGHEFVVLSDIVLHRRYHGDNLVAGRPRTGPLPLRMLKAKLDRERGQAAGDGGAES